MILRILLGILLVTFYSLVFTGSVDWFSAYNETQNLIFQGKSIGIEKARTGIFFIYIMAIGSIYLISFTKEWYKTLFGFSLVFLLLLIFIAFG